MQPVELTMKQVLVAARKAMDEGRLGKYSNPTIRKCFYRYADGSCCVIGAALSDEDAERFDDSPQGEYNIIPFLVAEGLVTVPREELYDMDRLQTAHDGIFCKQDAEAFLNLFKKMEAKYVAR